MPAYIPSCLLTYFDTNNGHLHSNDIPIGEYVFIFVMLTLSHCSIQMTARVKSGLLVVVVAHFLKACYLTQVCTIYHFLQHHHIGAWFLLRLYWYLLNYQWLYYVPFHYAVQFSLWFNILWLHQPIWKYESTEERKCFITKGLTIHNPNFQALLFLSHSL